MSLLWALPVAILAVGMTAVAAAARGAATAAADLRSTTSALVELRDAVTALHDDAATTTESFAALRRTRSAPPSPDH
jgi:cytochrome c-type biogenesis protein CcmH/NrfF